MCYHRIIRGIRAALSLVRCGVRREYDENEVACGGGHSLCGSVVLLCGQQAQSDAGGETAGSDVDSLCLRPFMRIKELAGVPLKECVPWQARGNTICPNPSFHSYSASFSQKAAHAPLPGYPTRECM